MALETTGRENLVALAKINFDSTLDLATDITSLKEAILMLARRITALEELLESEDNE